VKINIIPLRYLSLLSLTGPDAVTFLQGQATCDMTACTETKSINGALCNPQGRIYASFRIAKIEDQQYLLRTYKNIAESTQLGLAKYIVFSKAEIADIENQYSLYGINGDDAHAYINKVFNNTPDGISQSIVVEHDIVIQLDESGQRFECWLHRDSNRKTEIDTETNGDEQQWRAADIHAGFGEVEDSSQDLFIPQMLNYQITGQVSFTKGCYTGQEVVARMHYRGKLKRRMYLASVSSKTTPLAGQALYDGQSDQSIGNIVNAVSTEAGRYDLLAVITNVHAETGEVYLSTNADKPLNIRQLPYAVKEGQA
jgi:folate-binding protein YgfZ